MSFATLRALHASIGSAIDDLEHIYHDRSQSEPLEFPSLNDPYYVSAPHSAAQQLAHQLSDDPAVSLASKQIVAACAQLNASVSKPWYGFIEAILGLSACLRFAEASHLVEILREAGECGLHVDKLHRSILELRPKNAPPPDVTVFTPVRLAHVLRLLATSHWLREVSPDVFANNRRSSYIDSGKTLEELRHNPGNKYIGTDGVAAFLAVVGDESYKTMTYMTEWLLPDTRKVLNARSGKVDHASADQNPNANQYETAFNLAFDTQLTYFPWLETPGNEVRLERFGPAMTGTRQWETEEGILQGSDPSYSRLAYILTDRGSAGFQWATLKPGSVLVDVAGGIGSTSLTIAVAHPHINVIVDDRPQVVNIGPSSWGSNHTPLFTSGHVSWRVRDLFEPWKPLASGKAPDVFLLRLILHDWKDDECIKIMRILRSGAGPDTKLIIGDMLLPNACEAQDTFVQDGSPLLPNLGVANIHGFLMDLTMMSMFGANERTVAEMKALALAAGWKITDIRRSPGSVWAYSTAIPV
ncbi:S-adenosyl-L-methionine-dependent methyltransferase [Cubamyces menziesii]|nr:S-adenosyl-L-methionine-dependent methyltransferase [Cubamyces menziesii]